MNVQPIKMDPAAAAVWDLTPLEQAAMLGRAQS